MARRRYQKPEEKKSAADKAHDTAKSVLADMRAVAEKAASFRQIEQAVCSALHDAYADTSSDDYTARPYVRDIVGNVVIYEQHQRYWQVGYAMAADGTAQLIGDTQEVVQVVEWRPVTAKDAASNGKPVAKAKDPSIETHVPWAWAD